MSIITTVQKRIEQNQMLQKGDGVLVGLSGGPDSVALLLLLNRLKEKYRLDLAAVYINHNIRPRAALAEEKFSQELCDQLDIELYLVRENIPQLAKKFRTGLEETARDFRYGVYNEICRGFDYQKIALGHHYDDQVETVLFRITRGTGISGLSGIAPVRDNIIRPLYDLTKEEILSYLNSVKQSYCIDRSNKDLKIKRNYIRHQLLPSLRKNLNPAVDKALFNLARNSSSEDAYLNQLTQKAFKKIILKSRYNLPELDLDLLNKLEPWLKIRIFREILSRLNGYPPDRVVVERFEEFLNSKKKSLNLPGEYRLLKLGERLTFLPVKKIKFEVKLALNRRIAINELAAKISMMKKAKEAVKIEKKRNSDAVMLDFDRLEMPLIVRTIKSGDKFSPLGMKGSKKISDFLTDRKIAREYRNRIPVVCDQRGIVWVVGLEIDNRVKIDKSTKEVAKLEFHR